MLTLYHFPLSPFCRKVRMALHEKKLDVEFRYEPFWQRRATFMALNPAGEVPVMKTADGAVLAESQAIVEYLEECHPDIALLGKSPEQRAETRRLVSWFDTKFHAEVSGYVINEYIFKRITEAGAADADAIRAARHNIGGHLQYIGFLTERRNWLAGDDLSLADMAAAAHISCVDYVGEVPWHKHGDAKEWYQRIKSRPAFRPILADHLNGLPPARQYADLDF